jgi:hypothetical protein
MNQRIFFNLSAITNRIQEILQPYSGKLFWVKAEISSGRERGVFKELEDEAKYDRYRYDGKGSKWKYSKKSKITSVFIGSKGVWIQIPPKG